LRLQRKKFWWFWWWKKFSSKKETSLLEEKVQVVGLDLTEALQEGGLEEVQLHVKVVLEEEALQRRRFFRQSTKTLKALVMHQDQEDRRD
jgi:hypothetical protein